MLLDLLITQPPLGTVMSGVGACRVNNNIVLIDTCNELRGRGLSRSKPCSRPARSVCGRCC